VFFKGRREAATKESRVQMTTIELEHGQVHDDSKTGEGPENQESGHEA
jgi:hypothetical protein